MNGQTLLARVVFFFDVTVFRHRWLWLCTLCDETDWLIFDTSDTEP